MFVFSVRRRRKMHERLIYDQKETFEQKRKRESQELKVKSSRAVHDWWRSYIYVVDRSFITRGEPGFLNKWKEEKQYLPHYILMQLNVGVAEMYCMNFLAKHCSILKPENPFIDELYVAQKRRSAHFLSSKVLNVWSGYSGMWNTRKGRL